MQKIIEPKLKDKIDQAKSVARYTDSIRRSKRQTTIKHRIVRLIFIPIFFILINGLFFVILWITNILDVLKKAEGFIVTPLGILISIVYILFIYFLGKVLMRLTDKIGIPWLFDRD